MPKQPALTLAINSRIHRFTENLRSRVRMAEEIGAGLPSAMQRDASF